MNQENIGKFIANLRKENNLTQQDLADKLGVSKNAVSKWERGICLMDISLLIPISKIFNVSIAEILSGERIKQEITSLKTEEILEKAIYYSSNEIRKTKKIKTFKMIAIIFIFSLIIGFALFKTFINVNKDDNTFYAIPEDYSITYVSVNNISLKKGDKIDISIKDNNSNNELFNSPLLKNVLVRKIENDKNKEDNTYIQIAVPRKYLAVSYFTFDGSIFEVSITKSNTKSDNDTVIVNTNLYDLLLSEYFRILE